MAFVLLAACCSGAADVHGVLDSAEALDASAARAREGARASPDDFEAQWRAARLLFLAANRRLHDGILRNLAATPSIERLLAAEQELAPDQRRELLGLVEEGASFASRAVRIHPDQVAGHAYLGLNLLIAAACKGRAAALLEGLPARIRAACDEGLAIDRAYGGGMLLGLKGRFLSSAPWPVRDLREAEEAIAEACAISRNPLHLLFLGDLLWRTGDRNGARRAWEEARAAEADERTRPFAKQVRELARLRVEHSR
ncbi:MAG: hypothetical protein ACREID_01940 [Planctomycetota bacterium]